MIVDIEIIEVVAFHKASQKILLLKRNNPPLVWSTITGGIEEGEAPLLAAKREVFEETGNALVGIHDLKRSYTFVPQHEEVRVICHCFIAVFDSDKVTLNTEHSAYQWVDLETALEIIPYEDQRENLRKSHAAVNIL